jgi:hypothetical protein
MEKIPRDEPELDAELKIDSDLETDSEKRIKKRAAKPYDNAVNYLKEVNCEKYIDEYKIFYKKMTSNPYDTYIELRERLDNYGSIASFPEFKGVIFYLIKKIYQDIEFNDFCKSDKTMDNFRMILVHEIVAIMIESRYMYPYKATLLLIEQMLKIIDTFYRVKETKYTAYYHNFRYRVYLTYLLDNPNNDYLVMPVLTIGATDIIKLRCVPILVLGVSNEPVHADQYVNTPLDFWAHDMQHARRQIQETERYYDTIVKHLKYYDSRSPFDLISKKSFYKMMEKFTKEKILPMIALTPLKKKGDLDENELKKINGTIRDLNEQAKLRKLLLFEIVHEKAWPITKFSVCRNIKLGYDIFPIESMITQCGDEKIDYVDEEIMKSCPDLKFTTVDEEFEDPTTLSNTINKLRHGFYDDPDDTNSMIVDEKYRTSDSLVKQAMFILERLDCEAMTAEELMNLTKNTKNAEEFLQYPKVIKTPDNPETWTESPIAKVVKWKIEPDAPTNFIQSGGKKSLQLKKKFTIKNKN